MTPPAAFGACGGRPAPPRRRCRRGGGLRAATAAAAASAALLLLLPLLGARPLEVGFSAPPEPRGAPGGRRPLCRHPAAAAESSRAGARGRATPPLRLRAGAEAGEGAPAAAAAEAAKLSSVSQSAVNLVKNIVGAGMLSLPAGVASFSGSSKALIPAVALTILFGLLSAYGFVLIADACNRTGKSSYQDAWASLVSPSSKWLPALGCFANAAIGCVCFSMILGDCLSLILAPLGLPAAVSSRSATMLAVTAFVLLPLCRLRSLEPLAKFSAIGVLSNVYISLFIMLRTFDGTYRSGALLAAAPALPKFVAASGSPWSTALTPGVTVLLSMLGTAFLAHYNAPLFYSQLAPGPDGERGGRFLTVSVLGFTAAAVILCLVMVGGFLTFGKSCSGLILNSYASTDGLAALARIAIALSLITSYPIVFFSVREQFLDFLGPRGRELGAARPDAVTVALLGGVTATALRLTDLGKVAGFAGAVFGIFLIYIAPPVMALRALQQGIGQQPAGWRRGAGVLAQVLLIPLGAMLGAVGAVQTLR